MKSYWLYRKPHSLALQDLTGGLIGKISLSTKSQAKLPLQTFASPAERRLVEVVAEDRLVPFLSCLLHPVVSQEQLPHDLQHTKKLQINQFAPLGRDAHQKLPIV